MEALVFLIPEPWDFVSIQAAKFSLMSFTKICDNLSIEMLVIHNKQAKQNKTKKATPQTVDKACCCG